jgi:hypothetical protein
MADLSNGRCWQVSTRVYVLLDLVHTDITQVARLLRGKCGVTAVDVLEGPPDLLMVIEAPERQRAAEYLMDVLDSVGGMTEDLRVMPAQL